MLVFSARSLSQVTIKHCPLSVDIISDLALMKKCTDMTLSFSSILNLWDAINSEDS
jgi:hypothetical protein